ncbi:TetR/AcrR family transcriptional regulator [Streptomyces rugosispiralis]|uniref:TetR family transcriptional regulator n=1 Tax=Streptomyces rugosispiralis TaxID=2967341 RepID=A0ABT1UTF6_9ACTN|nr:TetR family transcriptional regulator [Streptomyces rugosispiralis]MCQ8187889.1 TetR family transcriptional regulator [Streptomyces rugosispiralis]
MAEQGRSHRRTNQMERTRSAIVAAARELADSGAEIRMSAIAAEARVSEATAYRHFPDLVSLLRAAVLVEDQVAVLRSVAEGDDPVERIGQAAEILGRAVLRREGAVRALVSSTIAKPETAKERPAHRFGLIEHALAPWVERNGLAGHEAVAQLVRDLAVVISAESLFTLIDLCGLGPQEAVAGLVATARRTTAAAVATITPAADRR